MPLIYYKADGSWTCGTCGVAHPKEETSCPCRNTKAVDDAEPATDHDLQTARHIVENVPSHGFVSVPARLLARVVKRAQPDNLTSMPRLTRYEVAALETGRRLGLFLVDDAQKGVWLPLGTKVVRADELDAARIDGNAKENAVAPPSEQTLLDLAIEYHKTVEGEYGCPGASCPGVQRLVVFLTEALRVG